MKSEGCLKLIKLVTLAGAAFLLFFLFRIGSGPLEESRRALAKATLQGFVIGVINYKREYKGWPIEAATKLSEEKVQSTQGAILNVLMAGEDNLNPRKIKFFDPPLAKDKSSGVFIINKEPVLLDPWGEPYYFILDFNGDGSIPNPDRARKLIRDSVEPDNLPFGVIIFSSGPDRDLSTWKDNIVSWR
jgi:hypothetical protein